MEKLQNLEKKIVILFWGMPVNKYILMQKAGIQTLAMKFLTLLVLQYLAETLHKVQHFL